MFYVHRDRALPLCPLHLRCLVSIYISEQAGIRHSVSRLINYQLAPLVGAMSTGIQRAIFNAALDFCKRETRGGATAIGNHQSVADLLMNIKMRTEASRYVAPLDHYCFLALDKI